MSKPAVLRLPDIPVRVRDGTILRADIYRPDTPAPVPAIVERRAYGKSDKNVSAHLYSMFIVAEVKHGTDGSVTEITTLTAGSPAIVFELPVPNSPIAN